MLKAFRTTIYRIFKDWKDKILIDDSHKPYLKKYETTT
jgi:hypothetical protein